MAFHKISPDHFLNKKYYIKTPLVESSEYWNTISPDGITRSVLTAPWVENKKITDQIIRVSEVCVQNGDRVSKNGKSSHICIMGLKAKRGKEKQRK